MGASAAVSGAVRVSIKDGLLCGPLDELDKVRLAGSRCSACGETTLGERAVCANCGSDRVSKVALAAHGTLWSFTVVRHRPPGNYKGPDPFAPFGLGLVELPDGLRVFSPVTCPISELRIGARLTFKPYLRTEPDGREVVAFTFVPAEGSAQ
jgi:uncharacterized OB-fold protein